MKQSEALDMITKLRLAQQAMESACKRIDELKEENKNLKEALAKQEQGEPVGYLEINDIESQREYPHNCRNVNLWYEGGEGLVAIYTKPQQRKPLTDEQIDNITAQRLKWQVSDLVRAIEAAHGIKE